MRASHLDLFEQPEIRFFNKPVRPWLEGRYEREFVQNVQAVQWFDWLTMSGFEFRAS
jgi:hypothetical protein